jgi:tRNA (guanosine-2'-O-)-methyltransferase
LRQRALDREDPEAAELASSAARPLPWGTEWTAEGVIATLEPLVNEARRERLVHVLDGRLDSVTVVMDAPHDPHNGAAVLRSCDAFGIQRVHIVARRESFMIARRVTQGAERWVDVVQHRTAESAVAALRGGGYHLVATHPQGELLPQDLAHISRLAVVLGNEHDGICDQLYAAAESTVQIPMRGFAESLNVSVSAAILLASAARRPGDLDDGQKRLLYARWLHHSLTRSSDILAAASAR